MDQTPTLRPLQFGEIIDAAFRLYTGNFKKLTIIAAVVLLPLGVLTLIAFDSMGFGEIAATPEAEISTDEALSFLGRVLAGGLSTAFLSLLGTALIQAASIRVYADTYQGIDNTWQESMRSGLQRLLGVVGVTLLVGFGSVFGLIACIAPGVWLWTSWYVTVPAMITESKGVIDSMTRSWNLIRPRFWPTLGVAVVTYLIIGLIQQAIGLVLGLVMTPLLVGNDPAQLAQGLDQLVGYSTMVSTLLNIVTLPFAAAVATVVYFDLRVRQEGFDIEQLARELGSASGETYRPAPPTSPDDPFGLGKADS